VYNKKYIEIARACWDSVKNIHYLPPAVYGMKMAYEKELKRINIMEEKMQIIYKMIDDNDSTEAIVEKIKFLFGTTSEQVHKARELINKRTLGKE